MSRSGAAPGVDVRGVDVAVLVAVTVFAVWLRVGSLGPPSLWLDDAWVALVHRTDGLTELRWVGFSAPGFAVLLRGWLGLVGFTETNAQLLPLLAGVAVPGVAYATARMLGIVRVAALVPAVVLATSPIAVDYATRVKQYTVESLLALVLVVLAWRLVAAMAAVAPAADATAAGDAGASVGPRATAVGDAATADVGASGVGGWGWMHPRGRGWGSGMADATAPGDAVCTAAPAATPDVGASGVRGWGWMHPRGRGRGWVAFLGVAAVATMVSTFLAVIVAAGLAAALVAALRAGDPRAVRRTLVAGAGTGVAALGWYLGVVAPVITGAVGNFWADHYLTLDAGFGAAMASLGRALVEVAAGLTPLPATVLLVLLALAAVLVGRDAPALLVLLAGPLVVAVVLAGLQLAPLGGGRTDVYLYPGLALLLGAGMQRVGAGRQRFGSGSARTALVPVTCGLLVLALLATSRPATPYPDYDVRPLVQQLAVERLAGDALLVYPATMWAYALYTDDDVHLDTEPTSSWGFAPRFADPDTAVLPPGRDDPDAYLPTVERLTVDNDRIWLLASHWRDDYDTLRHQLDDAGFDVASSERRSGAELTLWQRR